MRKTFTVLSPYDELPLQGVLFLPEGTPKGIVQIVHGMAERKERYAEFASFLAENGYIAACHDHRGHGESVKTEEDYGWFQDYDGKAIVDDTVAVTEYLKGEYPDLPLVLFGHSMGSLVVRAYIQEHDDLCDKLIVCGSPSKNGLVGVAIFLEKCIRLFCGKRHRSKLLGNLSTGNGNKPFEQEGECAWLSRNRERVEAYLADPACGFLFTCNGYENLFKLLKKVYKPKRYAVKNPDLPIRFVAGGDDPVIGDELKWLEAIELLREVGYANVSGKLYEGMRHEILNEIGREEVFSDLLAFIQN